MLLKYRQPLEKGISQEKMHLTLISATKKTPQPHWSVWYPKPDLACWRSVEKHLIWCPVSQFISFRVIVWPCNLGCHGVYSQASSTYASSASLQGENTWAARVQCPITLTPCKRSDHCDQYLCLTKYQKLKTCEWRVWPCLCWSSRGDRHCTCGNRTSRAGCTAHLPHVSCILKHRYLSNL